MFEGIIKEDFERTFRSSGLLPAPTASVEINNGTPAVRMTVRRTEGLEGTIAAFRELGRMPAAWQDLANRVLIVWENATFMQRLRPTSQPAPTGLVVLAADGAGDWDLRWHQCILPAPEAAATSAVQWWPVERAGRADQIPEPVGALLAEWARLRALPPEHLYDVTRDLRSAGHRLKFLSGVDPEQHPPADRS